jgi:phosphate starvation-inducible PhoH-like protein
MSLYNLVKSDNTNVKVLSMARNNGKKSKYDGEMHHIEKIKQIKKSKKYETERSLPPIMALNAKQAEYIGHLRTQRQVFVLGPAGTGKTWIASTYAADLYRNNQISRIILTRPNVPCGRSLGFFPGPLEKKFSPWAQPVIEAIKGRLGEAVFEVAIKNGDIEVVPFEVMRGRSWRDAFIFLDEAQNTTVSEIKMFLTRIGENCLAVINGDVSQCDLDQESGLQKAIDMIAACDLPVPIVEFSIDDIVRSEMFAMWSRAFLEAETKQNITIIYEAESRLASVSQFTKPVERWINNRVV